MSTPSPQHLPEYLIGRHRARIHGDSIEIKLGGDVTLEEYVELQKLYDTILAAHGYICILADAKQSGSIDARARRISGSWGQRNATRMCLALYDAPVPMRVIVTLIVTAIRMLTGQVIPLRFFDTEEQARNYLERFRKSHAAGVAAGP